MFSIFFMFLIFCESGVFPYPDQPNYTSSYIFNIFLFLIFFMFLKIFDIFTFLRVSDIFRVFQCFFSF